MAQLDARHWHNGWRLLVPPRVRPAAPWALAIVDRHSAAPSGTETLKVIVAGRGAVEAPVLGGRTARELAAAAKQLGVAALIVVERDAVRELARELEGSLRADDDALGQGLAALKALKKRAGRGVWMHPPLLELLPVPAAEPVRRTFDLLVPDDSALVAYVIEDDRSAIHASIIARKEGGAITRATTHAAIADLVPEAAFAKSWEKQAARVNRAVEERIGAPSISLFLERATVLRILTGPSDQLARELNAKRVVIDPAPTWLLGIISGATAFAMAGRAARGMAALLPQAARDRASALASRARDAVNPFGMLGFDPLELWAQLKHFYRP
ncbi:MAG TPA: hypothetical protein VGM88_15860 [Kofleriaceae bacterium]